MIAINLMPAPRQRLLAERRRLRAWVVGVLLYAAVLAAAFGVVHAMDGGSYDAATLQARATLDELNAANQASAEKHRQLDKVNAFLETARAVSRHPDWSRVLRLVAGVRPSDAVFDSVSVLKQADRRTQPKPDAKSDEAGQAYVVKISGICRTAPDVYGFVKRLEATKVFDRVTSQDIKARTLRGADCVQFTVECSVVEAGERP